MESVVDIQSITSLWLSPTVFVVYDYIISVCSMVVQPGVETHPITSLVLSHIPEAELERQHGKEVSYILPVTSADKFAGKFYSGNQD